MWPEADYQKALELIKQGINDCEIGRRLGIPRGTIRDWRVGLEAGSGGRTKFWSGKRPGTASCFRCEGGSFDEQAYAYLLGVYLGDGWIWRGPRDVYHLRISCDLNYPEIINEIATHIIIVRGSESVGFASKQGRCIDVTSYWKHWPCVFPQHGPGRKHERSIELTSWQEAIVTDYPKALIRGLIQSDGNRHINEVVHKLTSKTKRYRYSRYMFTNASTDILRIFSDALDMLGVHWTQTTARDISVARREDVAFLDTFVGPKR